MDLAGAAWRTPSSRSEDDGLGIEIAVLPGSKEGSDRIIARCDGSDPGRPR